MGPMGSRKFRDRDSEFPSRSLVEAGPWDEDDRTVKTGRADRHGGACLVRCQLGVESNWFRV